MLAQIKRLGTDTAIYGISTVVGRFLNFILVPFYTNVLHPNEYGVVANVYAIIAFLNIVYAYGMESAYFKYASTKELGSERQNFSAPFISLCVSSALFSAILVAVAPSASRWMGVPPADASVVPLSAGILFLDTVALVPFASLRMQQKALLFGALKILNIVVNVAANLILLLHFHAGVEGIFLSGLIASLVTVLALVPTIVRQFTPEFPRSLYRALLVFGLPYVPAGLASMVIQVVDRPIMRLLTSDATLGVYQANYRLGIFMMLIVSMFDYAWRPFFLAHADAPDAKKLFARVLTYFSAFMTCVFLVLTFFIGDIVRIRVFGRTIIHPDYWGGLSIVPVVLIAYMFLGIYNNLIAGVYIQKKTQHLPAITLIGALVNIVANFLLIPSMGMMGGAIATLLAYAAMAGALYRSVQSYYPVPYEWGRIAKVASSAAIALVLSRLCAPWLNHFALCGGLLLLFGASLYFMRFFDAEEMQAIGRLLRRGSAHGEGNPSVPDSLE